MIAETEDDEYDDNVEDDADEDEGNVEDEGDAEDAADCNAPDEPHKEDQIDGQDGTLVYAMDGETIDTAGKRLFALSLASKDALKEALSKYGLTFGFLVYCHGWGFTCNKAGFTKDRRKADLPEEKRHNSNRDVKVVCFKMHLYYTR